MVTKQIVAFRIFFFLNPHLAGLDAMRREHRGVWVLEAVNTSREIEKLHPQVISPSIVSLVSLEICTGAIWQSTEIELWSEERDGENSLT